MATITQTVAEQATTLEALLQTIISYKTISGDYAANHELLEYIDTFLSERGMYIKRYEFNGFESLVATTNDTLKPTVLLHAHTDVVPADDADFTITEKGERLYGRGVFDMKFAAAAFLKVVDNLRDNLHQYDFGIMINTDEELGGHNGTEKLVEAGYRPKMCICPDGGDDWAIETLAKGLWHFEVKTKGIAAHGSRPWEGDNAIDNLIDVLEQIRPLFKDYDLNSSTITIGTINGGAVVNQVPDTASAKIDIRFASAKDEARITAAIEAICEASHAEITTLEYCQVCTTDTSDRYIKSFIDAITDTIGYSAGGTISYAANDARFFAALDIPCAIVRPPGGGHHGPEEWISKQGLYDLETVLGKYLHKTAKP